MLAVKIYGERNCGTNYLEQLISNNLSVEILRYVPSKAISPFLKHSLIVGGLQLLNVKTYLGWKHGVPPSKYIRKKVNEDSIIILSISKNPYTFLLSLHKRPYHNRKVEGLSFSQFLRQPWQTILREGLAFKKLANPIELWNIKNSSYLSLSDITNCTSLNITYEDLINDPEQELSRIKSLKTEIVWSKESFTNVLNSTKGDNLTFEEYKTYYLNNQWLQYYTQDDLDYVNAYLDRCLMDHLGYESCI